MFKGFGCGVSLCACIVLPLAALSQDIKSVSVGDNGDQVTIVCEPHVDGPLRLLMTENDGRTWVELTSVSKLDSKAKNRDIMVWDIFKEYKEGVKEVRFVVVPATADFDINSIDENTYPRDLKMGRIRSSVVAGNKAYISASRVVSSTYAGDLRHQTWATATDNVFIAASVFVYDIARGTWLPTISASGWQGRVPRKHHHIFPAPKQPDYKLTAGQDGSVWLDGKNIVAGMDMSELFTLKPGFKLYARSYVEERLSSWQRKGEFEKTADYQARIKGERDEKIAEYIEDAKAEFIDKTKPLDLKSTMTLSQYDADNETFKVSTSDFGDLLVPVPIKAATKFKNNWGKIVVTPEYGIENDQLVLMAVAFSPKKGKASDTFYYRREYSGEYASADDIALDLEPVVIESPQSRPVQDGSDLRKNNFKKGTKAKPRNVVADIDVDVPSADKVRNDNTFAVIISNENYRRVAPVEYAHADGKSMENYMTSTLGIPADHIRRIEDATLNDIRNEIDWMRNVGDAYDGDVSFIFYYAGHGMPDASNRQGYLLPVDGYGSNVASGMSMSQLATDLGAIKSRISVVLLDACFSGARRSGDMLASERGVAIKAKPHKVDRGNVVVISASQDDQTAAKYDDQGHGLFTYFLLRSIKDYKGDVTLEKLVDEVTTNVRRQSIVTNNKAQIPSVTVSPDIADSWKSFNLKELSKR